MQQTLFYLGNLAVIAYLAYSIGKQIYETAKIKKLRQWAQAEYETAHYEMDVVRQDQLTLISKVYAPVYGSDIVEQINKRIYFEGMPMILLLTSLGKPDKVQDGNYKGTSTSKWYYGQTTNRVGNPVYDIEITLEDYVVVGWKDLR